MGKCSLILQRSSNSLLVYEELYLRKVRSTAVEAEACMYRNGSLQLITPSFSETRSISLLIGSEIFYRYKFRENHSSWVVYIQQGMYAQLQQRSTRRCIPDAYAVVMAATDHLRRERECLRIDNASAWPAQMNTIDEYLRFAACWCWVGVHHSGLDCCYCCLCTRDSCCCCGLLPPHRRRAPLADSADRILNFRGKFELGWS